MPGINNFPDGSYIVLQHHNWAYTYDQAMSDVGGFLQGRDRITVSQLIEFLKKCNPDSTVLISSDHGTVGPCLIEDIKQYDQFGNNINDEENENE